MQLHWYQALLKRCFDVLSALVGLLFFGWVILIAIIFARCDTGMSGIFSQSRVGKDGHLFKVFKIRTMRPVSGVETSVTQAKDPRITPLGVLFRKTKIDELPQLWNVLIGEMSLVGPRPDVPGYADKLVGQERAVLSLRPGITGPASLKYHDEEQVLAQQDDPQQYNDTVIYPDKVQINLQYIRDWSLIGDLKYIFQTIFR